MNLISYTLQDWIQIVLGFATVFIAFLAFIIARKVHKEFIKNQTKTKQVEAVDSLVHYLNESKINIMFTEFKDHGYVGSGSGLFYNIFEVGGLLIKGDELEKSFDNQSILFHFESNQILDIKQYIDNPFLPKTIADELMNFYSIDSTLVPYTELYKENEILVIIETGIFEKRALNPDPQEGTYVEGSAFALETWLNLKTSANNLTLIINKWFSNHGIDDFNLRIDYKNVR